MKKKNILNVLYQSDDNYADLIGISITSLLINNQDLDEINVYLLNLNIKENNIKKLKKVCAKYNRNLIIMNVDKILTTIQKIGVPKFHGGYSSYLKLFCLRKLQLKGNLILYIDGDTIVNGSLRELLNINMEGYVFGGVCDGVTSKYKTSFNIDENKMYINGGVFLLNQKEWKVQKCEDKIIKETPNIKYKYNYADQDIINMLFSDKILKIDLKYNFCPGIITYGPTDFLKIHDLNKNNYYTVAEIEKAVQNVAIYHCLPQLSERPWEVDTIHPYKDIFLKYKNISLWKDMPLKKSKKTLFYRIQRFMYLYFPRGIYLYIHKKALYFECSKLLKENKKYFNIDIESEVKK